MRQTFIEELCRMARADERIVLLVGDVGYNVVEPFEAEFPDRFFNCGIAEQNMMGVAAGLAHGGKRPWVYSMGNFVTLRCAEQVSIDIAHHCAPVVIVGVGGGSAYENWPTHRSVIDDKLMALMENMTVCVPKNPEELVMAMHDAPRPTYIKVGRYE